MKDQLKKNERMTTILKMRKAVLENEHKKYSDLLFKKNQMEQQVMEFQNSYLEGVDKVNHLRSSTERQSLSVFEDLVDHSKRNWAQCHREVSHLQNQLTLQGKKVQEAYSSVKAAEHLKDKAWKELQSEVVRQEEFSMEDAHRWKYQS